MSSEPVVMTSDGGLRGKTSNGITIFTFEYGAPCAQGPRGWNDAIASVSSEDCLFLNIWVPPRTGKVELRSRRHSRTTSDCNDCSHYVAHPTFRVRTASFSRRNGFDRDVWPTNQQIHRTEWRATSLASGR
jgi:hypothetical protein